jgi:hypothetical protein
MPLLLIKQIQNLNRESALKATEEVRKELISSVQDIAKLIRFRIISVTEYMPKRKLNP